MPCIYWMSLGRNEGGFRAESCSNYVGWLVRGHTLKRYLLLQHHFSCKECFSFYLAASGVRNIHTCFIAVHSTNWLLSKMLSPWLHFVLVLISSTYTILATRAAYATVGTSQDILYILARVHNIFKWESIQLSMILTLRPKAGSLKKAAFYNVLR